MEHHNKEKDGKSPSSSTPPLTLPEQERIAMMRADSLPPFLTEVIPAPGADDTQPKDDDTQQGDQDTKRKVMDVRWLRQLQRREDFAWSAFVDLYHNWLESQIQGTITRYYFMLNGVDPDIYAADALAETWKTIVDKIPEFEWQDEDRFRHWLVNISSNKVKKVLGVGKRQEEEQDGQEAKPVNRRTPISLNAYDEESFLDAFAFEYHLYSQSVEDEFIYREVFIVIESVIRELPSPRDQAIVNLCLIQEEPYRVVAKKYNLTISAVGKIVSKARKKILLVLKNKGLEP